MRVNARSDINVQLVKHTYEHSTWVDDTSLDYYRFPENGRTVCFALDESLSPTVNAGHTGGAKFCRQAHVRRLIAVAE